MRLDLDFVAKRSAVSLPGALMLGMGVLATALALQQALATQSEIKSLQQALDIAGQQQTQATAGSEGEQSRARMLMVGQVVQKKVVPWDALFRDIEAASSADIGLLSVEPDVAQHQVKISGEARNAEALTAYIKRLGQKSSLSYVYLTQHELHQEAGYSVLHFDLTATWTGVNS